MVTTGGFGADDDPVESWNPMANWALAEREADETGEPLPPLPAALLDDAGEPVTSDEYDQAIVEAVAGSWVRPETPLDPRALTGADAPAEERPQAARPAPAPEEAPEPVSVAPAASGEHTKAYKVRDHNWRAERGIPTRRRKVPPSWTTEARRRRHVEAKAQEWGVSFEEADRRIKRRPAATRRGRAKAARETRSRRVNVHSDTLLPE